MTNIAIPTHEAPDPEVSFSADEDVFERVHKIIGKKDVKHGLESAMGACAGSLLAVFSYLVAAFGRAEAEQIVTKTVREFFARVDRTRN